MKLALIVLAVFLIIFGAITGFGLGFSHSALVLGVLAVAAGVLMLVYRAK